MSGQEAILQVPIDEIEVAGNVRRRFDEKRMEELAESIRQVGVLQPVVLRRGPVGGHILVCGERRLRAAREAGLPTVPAVVRELTEHEAREFMLIENLQRQDLDPVEEASGFQELLEGHGYKQQELAKRLGISQSQVSNRLRLLRLPPEVLGHISREILTPGHGMALLKLEKSPELLTRAAHHLVETKVPVAGAATAVDAFAAEKAKPLGDRYGGPRFDTRHCKSCEFRITVKHWRAAPCDEPVCIKGECWDRRQAEATASDEAVIDKKVRQLQAAGQETVRQKELEKLPWGEYQHLYGNAGFDESGCEMCRNRKVVIDRGTVLGPGNRPLAVCLDPACYRRKKSAATRAANKQQREAAVEYAEEAQAWAAQRADDGPTRENLQLLAALVLLHVRADYLPHQAQQKFTTWLKDRHGWQLGQALYDLEYHGWPRLRENLERLSERELLTLALEWAAVARQASHMMNEAMGRPILAEPVEDAAGELGDEDGQDDQAELDDEAGAGPTVGPLDQETAG